jgi:hypothetical protein
MQLTLYPNNELRARVTAAPLSRRIDDNRPTPEAESLNLSIVENLRSDCPTDFFRPEKNVSDRPGYGFAPKPRAFSLYARRKIVRTGALLGLGEARPRTLFLTGTLPGGTEAAMKALSDYSSWAVHELLTHIPRLWGGSAIECRFIWVWEWQERGALHWHCVLECPSDDAARAVSVGFRALWVRVIEGVGRKASVDMAERLEGGTWADCPEVWRVEVEPSRKNPARYLAKYLSKAKQPKGSDRFYPPTRWYGASRSLHIELRDKTLVSSTSFKSGVPDYRVDGEIDLGLIERLFGFSHLSRQFPDRVRDGFTFVFYIREEHVAEVRGIMKEYYDNDSVTNSSKEILKVLCPWGLIYVADRSYLCERFLGELGEFYSCLFEAWRSSGEVDPLELSIMENHAKDFLVRCGVKVPSQGALSDSVPLTGRESDKLGSSVPPSDGIDQASLFP